MCHRTFVSLVALGLATSALAQPAPLVKRIGGVYVGDLTLDQIYLTRDLNGDGDADDAGEATVFFDDTNLSGLASPTGSVFAIFQAADRTVYYTDGGTDAVYWIADMNDDRDALDAGEAGVWFSDAANAAGFGLPTPNGVWQGDDGAVYILNAGTGSNPSDAIYRTVDLNMDGDANDAGEATLWFDIQTLVTNASPFELVMIGAVAYYSDTVGSDPDAIFRAEDTDGSGAVDAGEFNIFIDETSVLVTGVGTGLVTDGTSLSISESSSSADQSVYRLTDVNASGTIDDPSESEFVWNEALVPAGFSMGSSFGLAIGPEGELAVGSAGATDADNVFRLVDENDNGSFFDFGETIVWANGGLGTGDFIDNPRALEYALPRVGDVNGDDLVGFADLTTLLAAWGPCGVCPEDLDDDGSVGFTDLTILLAAWDV